MSEDAQDNLSSSGEPLHEEGTAWPDTTRPENLIDPDGAHQEATEELGGTAVSEATQIPVTEGVDNTDRVEGVEKAHEMALAGNMLRSEASEARKLGEDRQEVSDPSVAEQANEKARDFDKLASNKEEEAGEKYDAERSKEARLKGNAIEAELFRILEQKLALGRREEELRRELSQMRKDGLVPPEPTYSNPDMEIDPETGADRYGFTSEDHAQGRYRSHGLIYRDWNDPGAYD
jgi:hypothetical protein